MPTQRHKEKRVEEHASAWEREGEKEKERTHRSGGGEKDKEIASASMHTWERERETERTHEGVRERESTLAPPFIRFFLPLGLPYANWT